MGMTIDEAKEPTNDLGVDCISRETTVKRLCNLAEYMNEHKENSGDPYIMAALFIQDNKTEFPSVTPPTKIIFWFFYPSKPIFSFNMFIYYYFPFFFCIFMKYTYIFFIILIYIWIITCYFRFYCLISIFFSSSNKIEISLCSFFINVLKICSIYTPSKNNRISYF